MKLRKPWRTTCNHVEPLFPDGHWEPHTIIGKERPTDVTNSVLGWCPGGVFLPDDALVIEKVDGEWPTWAVEAILNGPYTEQPREILDGLVRNAE